MYLHPLAHLLDNLFGIVTILVRVDGVVGDGRLRRSFLDVWASFFFHCWKEGRSRVGGTGQQIPGHIGVTFSRFLHVWTISAHSATRF